MRVANQLATRSACPKADKQWHVLETGKPLGGAILPDQFSSDGKYLIGNQGNVRRLWQQRLGTLDPSHR